MAATSVVGAGASAVGACWDYQGAKKGEPVIVTPPIEDYSKELQAATAAEMRAIADTGHGQRQRLLGAETPGY